MRQIMQWISTLVNNPLSGLIGLISGVTGIIASLLALPIFVLPDKMICYSPRSISIVDDKINKFNARILYEDQDIERLTLTRVAIWNGGKKTIINGNNMPDIKNLRITSKNGCEILKLDVVDIQYESENNFKCEVNNSNTEARIKFSFLKKKEGATIQITHTGLHENIQVLGTVLDGELRRISYTKSRENISIYLTTLASASVAVFVNLILLIFVHVNISSIDISGNWYIFVLFAIIFIFIFNYVLGLLAEWILYKRRAGIPKKFRKFHEQSWEI